MTGVWRKAPSFRHGVKGYKSYSMLEMKHGIFLQI